MIHHEILFEKREQMPRGSDISVGIPVIGYFKSLTDALIGFWFWFNFLLVMVLAFMTAGSWFHILIRLFIIYFHFFLSLSLKEALEVECWLSAFKKKWEAQRPLWNRKCQICWMAAWLADGQTKEEWASQRHWHKKILTNKEERKKERKKKKKKIQMK